MIKLNLVLVISCVCLSSCIVIKNSPPKLELHKSGTISSSHTFEVRNITLFRVDPNGQDVHIDWRGFNVRTGSAFNLPYEEILISTDSERYLVSDQKAGNNQLIVNGELFEFNSSTEQLLIKFGSGVSIEQGGYQVAPLRSEVVDPLKEHEIYSNSRLRLP